MPMLADARRCSYFELGLPVVFDVGFGQFFIFSLRHINLTLGLLLPRGQMVWRHGQGLKLECADNFHQSFLWLLRHTGKRQKGRNSCLWLQSRSVLSSFGVVLMSCRVNFPVVRSALQYCACRI